MSAKCHKRTFRPSAHAMVGDGGPERDDQRRRCADQFKSKHGGLYSFVTPLTRQEVNTFLNNVPEDL